MPSNPQQLSTTNKPKRTRSRNGCHSCKKSKIKCDEKKPKCSNCIKLKKECDYSLKLTWGGRPYKKPRIEKMNPVASLAVQHLIKKENSATIQFVSQSPDAPTTLLESSPSTPSVFPTEKNSIASKKVKIKEEVGFEVENTSKISSVNNPNPKRPVKGTAIQSEESQQAKSPSQSSPSIFLNPSNNLKFLLNMTTRSSSMESQLTSPRNQAESKSPKDTPEASNQEHSSKLVNNDFASLEEFYSTPRSPSLNPLFNDHVSNNIQSVSTYLGNVFNDDLMKSSNSWSILDQLGEQMSPDNQHIAPYNHLVPEDKLNTPVLDPSIHQNLPNMLDNDAEFQLDEIEEYTDDLAKLEALHPTTSRNFSPIPLLYQQRVLPKFNWRVDELEEELDEEQMRFHTPTNNHELVTTSPEGSAYPTTTSEVTPAQFWNSIPNGLMPLPDILLNVPEYLESFMFFLNSTSAILIPADSSIYRNNPFKVVLPKLAMTNDGLMSLCISFGLSHKNLLTHQSNDPTGVLDQLLSRALSELLLLLQDKLTATSDLTLTLVLFMSTLIAFTHQSDKWKIHLKGAKQILLMRGYKKPFSKLINDFKANKETKHDSINSEIKQSRLIYFLVRWYAYDDIFTKLSSPLEPSEDEIMQYMEKLQRLTRPSSDISSTSTTPWSLLGNNDTINSGSPSNPVSDTTPLASAATNTSSNENTSKIEDISNNNDFDLEPVHQLEYDIDEDNDPKAIVHDESHEDIDYFLGFNIKFLPLFSQLSKLIKYANILKRVQRLKNNGDNGNLNEIVQLTPKLVTRAIEMQSDFQKLNNNTFVESTNPSSTSTSSSSSTNPDSEDACKEGETKSLNSIVATNQCFLYMGLIQLYRRVLQIPKNSKLIQEMSNSIIKLYKRYIDEDFPGQLCLLLPMFIGAAECLDSVNRELFVAAFGKFHSKGSPTAKIGLDIVKMCWEREMDWWDVVTTEKIDVALL